MIRKLRCWLGRHAFLFAYVQVGTAYVAEIACMHCLKRATAAHEARAALRCARGEHEVQALTAPPTWRKGDGWRRGTYCIWCAMPDGPRVLDDRFGVSGGNMLGPVPADAAELLADDVAALMGGAPRRRPPESRW